VSVAYRKTPNGTAVSRISARRTNSLARMSARLRSLPNRAQK